MRYGLSFLAVVLVAAAAIWYAISPIDPIPQGLDLRGGMRVVLEVRKPLPPGIVADESTMEIARDIVENRVNAFGLSGADVRRRGAQQIIVMMPGATQQSTILQDLLKTANLEFRYIPKLRSNKNQSAPYQLQSAPDGNGEIIADAQGKDITQQVLTTAGESELIVSGRDLKPTSRQEISGQGAEPVVIFEFKPAGAQAFGNFTSSHVGENLAIVLDERIISAPVINEAITQGSGHISGNFTVESARSLARLLNSGALPIPLQVAQLNQVGATLGRDAVNKSIYAGLAGLVGVLLFMLGYYLLPGLVANLSLIIYAAITFALFKIFNIVLDLPGIAGFILSTGMAVDANVLIFERLKEELRAGKTIHAAIDAGFDRAWSSILDSNVTTWITCAVLYVLGTALIKGFAITLGLGILVSMFTAVFVTRILLHFMVNFGFARNQRLYALNNTWLTLRFERQGRWLPVFAARRLYFGISIVMLILGVLFLVPPIGGLRPGIDFTGGLQVQAVFQGPVDQGALNQVLSKHQLTGEGAQITRGSVDQAWTQATVKFGELSVTDQATVRRTLVEGELAAMPQTYNLVTQGKESTATVTFAAPQQTPITQEAIRAELAEARLQPTNVQAQVVQKPNLPMVVLTTARRNVDRDVLRADLNSLGGGLVETSYSAEQIGPSIARETTQSAFLSVLVASVLIILYVAIRFAIGGFANGLKFGFAAVLSLLHDTIVLVGIFALMGHLAGWEVNSLFVTGVLTIIGYSVNDTVVVYDRIRENLVRRQRGETFVDIADKSITQTFDRSLNTAMGALFVLGAIILFGGESIKGLSWALFIGIILGTYSSIFVASPLVVVMERWIQGRSETRKQGDVALSTSGGGGRSAAAPRPTARPAQPSGATAAAGTAPRPAAARPAAAGDGDAAGEKPATRPGSRTVIKPKRRRQ